MIMVLLQWTYCIIPGFLHGDDHNAVVLLGMVTEDGDDKVGVERV